MPPNERDLGVVFQDYAVWPHMTVFDNVAYPLKLARSPAAELRSRTLEAVALVDLGGLEERLPSQLSGGQQQRVALARALVSRPSLMLLDEPLNNLDANLREEMRFEIKALQKRLGITILYVTHDQEIALAISDRIAVMDEQGRMRQVGTPEEIFEHPVDHFVFRFLGIANFLPVRARRAAGLRLPGSGRPFPWATAPPGAAARWLAGFRPSDVRIARDGDGLPAGSGARASSAPGRLPDRRGRHPLPHPGGDPRGARARPALRREGGVPGRLQGPALVRRRGSGGGGPMSTGKGSFASGFGTAEMLLTCPSASW